MPPPGDLSRGQQRQCPDKAHYDQNSEPSCNNALLMSRELAAQQPVGSDRRQQAKHEISHIEESGHGAEQVQNRDVVESAREKSFGAERKLREEQQPNEPKVIAPPRHFYQPSESQQATRYGYEYVSVGEVGGVAHREAVDAAEVVGKK